MAKANYKYQIENYAGRDVIVIVDQDLGNMSVTNDIENVIKEIGNTESIDPEDYMIVYCDSMKNWDGYDVRDREFIFLGTDTWKRAVEKYVQLQILKA